LWNKPAFGAKLAGKARPLTDGSGKLSAAMQQSLLTANKTAGGKGELRKA